MTNRSLRFAAGISSISALALVMVACGGSSSSSPAVATAQPPSTPLITTGPTSAITKHVYTYNLSATDPQGDALTFQLSTANADATINGNVLTYKPTTPATGTANVTLSVVAKNAHNLTSTTPGTITIAVSANRAPQFTSLQPTYTLASNGSTAIPAGTTLTVNAIDPDTDSVTYALDQTSLKVLDNNGKAVTGATATIDAKGVITFTGTVPTNAVSMTFDFDVTATDVVPNGTGDSTKQHFTAIYNSGNVPPVILTSSLPSLAANHYIPSKKGDPGFLIQASDANVGDVLTFRIVSPTSGLKLVAGPDANSVYLVSDTGFVPKNVGDPFSVTIGVSDGHNTEVQKVFTIPVVGDSVPTLNSTLYTETVSGVNFFNSANTKWDITQGVDLSTPATARKRFYPGSVAWVPGAYYANYTSVGGAETFGGASSTEVAAYDNAFSGYAAYPAGFLGDLAATAGASQGWNARTLFADNESDKIQYSMQGGSVYVAGTYFNTVGQTFTVSGKDGATATTTPSLAGSYPTPTAEYPAVRTTDGTLSWLPITFEADGVLGSQPGVDNWGVTKIWSVPSAWSFTVVADELVYNPLGTGAVKIGTDTFDKVSGQKGIQNYTVKVQPNNRPVIGALNTIPGATTTVAGSAVLPDRTVASTTLSIGGGASLSPTVYGRPSIQEPESRRFDIGAGTGFDYTQANTVLPAEWRWLMARAGGNATVGAPPADVQIYDPDTTVMSGHQDTVVASMNAIASSGIPGDPLPTDSSNNVPALDASSKFVYNPWTMVSDAGSFQVNWGPNRNQYLLARIAGTMNLSLPVDVRDQYQRQASAQTRINPVFGTVRFLDDRTRNIQDSPTYEYTYARAGAFNANAGWDDGAGHFGDNVVMAPGTSPWTFTYLPFPGTLATDETNYGTQAVHIFDGTSPASGVLGAGAAAVYTAASWITLYATEAPQVGYHTGNPLNDEAKFNKTAYASALDGTKKSTARADWKTFGYTWINGKNPSAPVEEPRYAVGYQVDHEVRAQVIPSNSPYLFMQSRNNAPAAGYNGNFPLEYQGNTLQLPRTPAAPWYAVAGTTRGWVYGLYQGEIDMQNSVAGRAVSYSNDATVAGAQATTLRWSYSWPTQITNPNLNPASGDPFAQGKTNAWLKGDVMQIAVPNMGANGRFFFTGDGSQNDTNATTIEGWGNFGLTTTAGIVDTDLVVGTSTATATGLTIANNTPFHVPSNSIWVPNNRFGAFVTQHFNLPNRTTFSPGSSATNLSFTGIKGYMQAGLAVNAAVDPGYLYQDSAVATDGNTNPALIDTTTTKNGYDQMYFLWMRQDPTAKTAWGTWEATKLVGGASTYTATGGETDVPGFAMTNKATTSTYSGLGGGAQISLASGNLPGVNHAANVFVPTDASLYNTSLPYGTGWTRSQWGLLAPTMGYQPYGITTQNVRLVNPSFDSTAAARFTNTVAAFRSTSAAAVSTDGGVRDSAIVYAVRRHADEHGNALAELGLAGIEPGSPMLAQWYNVQLTGDQPLDGSTIAATSMTDVDSKSWPQVFNFYSPFTTDPAWANVMEFKVNFLVGVTYPNAAPASLVKVPAVVANVFPLGAPVTDPTCTNANNVVNPGNPIIRPIETLQISDFKANNTTATRTLSVIDLMNSNPTDPVNGGANVVNYSGNKYIQALSNVQLKWQSSVNNQVLPSGYIVELYQLTSTAGTDVNQPTLLATFRTGHIGGKDAVQNMYLPSMHSFSGRVGAAGVATEAVYFFKVRTVWMSGIQMEKQPTKQSLPMAYADYVSAPFVTQ